MKLVSKKEIIDKIESVLLHSLGSYMTPQEITNDAILLSDSVVEDLNEVKEIVKKARKRIVEWNGSEIEIAVGGIYEEPYSETGLSWNIEVYVGESSFTHFHGNHVGDVLEDFQDFSSKEQMLDYQNLVSEIQKPNSTNSEKRLVLYTAQPVGFERNRKIPKGLFLTSDYKDAQGLAHDRNRKVYIVVLSLSDLIQTKKGRVRWYQVKRDAEGEIEIF